MFTRENFRKFLSAHYRPPSKDKNGNENTLNKWITCALSVDQCLEANELKGFSYYPVEIDRDHVTLTNAEMRKIWSKKMPYGKDRKGCNFRYSLLYQVLAVIGPRISEILELRWDQLIETPTHYDLLLKNTKTRQQRKVPIGRKLGEQLLLLPRHGENGYVFTSYRGKPLNHQEINLDLKRRAEACNIDKEVSTRTFRRTSATQKFARHMELSDIMDIHGWTDSKTALRYKKNDTEHLYTEMLSDPFLSPEADFGLQTKRIQENLENFVFPKYLGSVTYKNDQIVIVVKKRRGRTATQRQ